jgi:excisionase family DNA binding protein
MTIAERLESARQQELLTVEEVALITRYTPKWIYEKASKGEIPGVVRFGRGLRFVRTEVVAWQRRRIAQQ